MNEKMKNMLDAVNELLNNASKPENRIKKSVITSSGVFSGVFTVLGKDLTAVDKAKRELENELRSG